MPGKTFMKTSRYILTAIVWFLMYMVSSAQTTDSLYLYQIEKCYNIFFPINSSEIDSSILNNSHTINAIRRDIRKSASILIRSTSSPDGSLEFNRNLTQRRAASTSLLIREIFPEIPTSKIEIQYQEEDWAGLRQILRTSPDFPQRDEMLMIIESPISDDEKEKSLRGCKDGWENLVNNHLYALRNSSVILNVIGGARDEFGLRCKSMCFDK